MFIKNEINYKIRDDLSVFIPHVFESLFIEIGSKSDHKRSIIGVIYRPNTAPKADIDIFSSTLFDIMDSINNEHKHGIIMGDMNIDLLKFGSHNKTNDYLDNIFCRGYIPAIMRPTRVTRSSATLIDHIYTNNICASSRSGIIITDVADHFGIFHLLKTGKTKASNPEIRKRFFTENNNNVFKTLLDRTDFSNIYQMTCPNEAFNAFIEKYQIAFNEAYPSRLVKVNRKYIKREVWFTPGLLASSRTRSKLLTKKLKDPSLDNTSKFNKYNNLFNKIKRSAKIKYYNDTLDKNKFNMKKTWSILREVIGKKNDKSSFPQEFKIDNEIVTNRTNIAESFNNYFSTIGSKTGKNVSHTNAQYTDYLMDPHMNSMFIDPVTPADILNATRKLKSKHSSGHDEISSKLLKDTIHNIHIPITHIVNLSFSTGIVPNHMKIAKVIPIFKASDPQSIQNYRPISLLTSFSKLLEKIMYDRVITYLNSHNILYKHQYGFRSNHSTIHPIIHLLNHCAEHTNTNIPEYTLAVLCDLSKAFDVINHDILLKKLNVYGIRGIVNKWFASYLCDRSQFVDIDGNTSSSQSISCGVPQGSILGPLLYLLYVNDIHKSCNSNILSFADDTTLFVSNSDIGSLYEEANKEINSLYMWFCANKLSLNAKKTKYIILRPQSKKCAVENKNIVIDGVSLERIGNDCVANSTKFLGICLDENLTWKHHTASVNSKISHALFSIKQVKNILPVSILHKLYFALIHPHISYGILSWGNAGKTVLQKTTTLQKRAIRMINKKSYNSHTDPLFRSSKILKIQDLYNYQSAIFMFDYTRKKLPNSFDSVFPYNHEIQSLRFTRQSRLLHIPRCVSNFASKLPLYMLPSIWNKWASHLSENTTRNQLKKHVKSTLTEHYSSNVYCSNTFCTDCRK